LRVKLICKRKVKTFKSNLASKTWRKKTLIVIKVKLTGKKFGLELHFGDIVEVCGEVPHVVHAIARQRLGGRHHGQSGHILQQIFSSLNKENKD
jgi:hypothetical protein